MPEQTFHTSGGPVIQKLQKYIQGNEIVILNVGLLDNTGIQAVLEWLGQVLGSPDSSLWDRPAPQEGAPRLVISLPGLPDLVLSEEVARALPQAAADLGEERAYLSALVLDPDLRPWQAQYVPLQGVLTAQEKPADWPGDWSPQYCRVLQASGGPQPQLRYEDIEDVTQALEKDPAIALIGEPGAGKTTTLSRLALQAAHKRLAGKAGPLPLRLSLADFTHGEAEKFVREKARRALGEAARLDERIRRQELLLLFDSLNEMPYADDADYARKVRQLQQLVKEWPGNQFVFTCRTLDYSQPLDLPQVLIKEMDDDRVQDFLKLRLGPQEGAQVWVQLRDSELLELFRNPWYLNMLAFLVRVQSAWPANRAGLFRGFTAGLWDREQEKVVAKGGTWPGQAVLEAALAALAAVMTPAGRGTRMPRREALAALPRQLQVDGQTISLDAGQVLALGTGASLLRQGPPPEQKISFYHHQLQEYFAAQELLRRFREGEDLTGCWRAPVTPEEMPPYERSSIWDPMPPPPGTGWEEATRLAVGLAALPDTPFHLSDLLARLEAVNPVLAADCLLEPGLPKEALAEPKRRLQPALLRRMTDERAHLRARLAAGEALGRLGDPRFEELWVEGQRVLLPPFIPLPGGSFQMGTDRTSWEALEWKSRGLPVDDEHPRHSQSLPPFQVAQFPVTNAEFRCFVEAGGYAEERYWKTAEARAWRRGEQDLTLAAQSEFMRFWRFLKEDWSRGQAVLKSLGRSPEEIAFWEEFIQLQEAEALQEIAERYQRPSDRPAFWEWARFNNPAQPVVGVTWFEAAAYCCWLDEKLRQCGRLADAGLQLRLPSEVEWEYAARGGAQREFPWDGGFAPERANTLESGIGRPTPVGLFSRGASAHGLLDMAGNVWEWTLSRYRPYPYDPQDGREAPGGGEARVVRGGSWGLNEWYARCAYRNGDLPAYFNDNLGFRVVRSLAVPGF